MVWVTEIDNPDGVFIRSWVDEERLSHIYDGDVYIRLRRAGVGTVDAELVLAHDAQLIHVMRLIGVEDWAQQLRMPAAAIMSLHTDLESGEPCKSYAAGAAVPI